MSPSAPVLAAGIDSFAFHDGGRPVLCGVDIAVAPGTLTAVLGASGSGKTTVGRLLAGWLTPGQGGTLTGYLELAGSRLDFGGGPADPRVDPAQWGRLVGFVPQDASTALSTVRATVAEELAFGLENAGVDAAAMKAAVERTAGLLGLAGLLGRDPARLSGGQLRRLAIGCAIITGPPVLVMDEPFASLDAEGASELGALVRGLVHAGTAVVILSQETNTLLLEADTWLVLDGGTASASGTPALLQSGGLVPAGIRRAGCTAQAGSMEQAGSTAQPRTPAPNRTISAGTPALELHGVTFGYGHAASRAGRRFRSKPHPGVESTEPAAVLREVNLDLRSGEIVAVTGPNGAGKSTLLRHFNGLLRPSSGTVRVAGTDIAGAPVGRTAASVGLLFQHPRDQLFERTVLREVRFGLDGLCGRAEAGERAQAALAAVGLGGSAGEHPAELSASRQRLLALATVLARRPSVLALDEPTVALDADGLGVLDAAVRSAASDGAAVVLVTHDLAYARAAARRVLRLDDGRLTPA